jgi:uncharacterized protein YcbK (DUF882 family)
VKLSSHLDTEAGDRLTCSCGCGMGSRAEHWPTQLLDMFEAIRLQVGCAVFVTSAWRCPRHNERIAQTEKSQHSIGAAMDLLRPKGMRYVQFYNICERVVREFTHGQGGVGRYTKWGFVHVDLGLNVDRMRRWGE